MDVEQAIVKDPPGPYVGVGIGPRDVVGAVLGGTLCSGMLLYVAVVVEKRFKSAYCAATQDHWEYVVTLSEVEPGFDVSDRSAL